MSLQNYEGTLEKENSKRNMAKELDYAISEGDLERIKFILAAYLFVESDVINAINVFFSFENVGSIIWHFLKCEVNLEKMGLNFLVSAIASTRTNETANTFEIISILLRIQPLIDINQKINVTYGGLTGFVECDTTILHESIIYATCPVKTVKLLLETQKNIDVNMICDVYHDEEYCSFSLTPLMTAIRSHGIEIMELLLKHPNIDVNKPARNEMTPLLFGIFSEDSNVEEILLLLEHPDIEINKQNESGYSALMLALNDLEILRVLLEQPNIDVNLQLKYSEFEDWSEYTALMIAAERCTTLQQDLEVFKLLLKNCYTNLYIQNSKGFTVFDILYNLYLNCPPSKHKNYKAKLDALYEHEQNYRPNKRLRVR